MTLAEAVATEIANHYSNIHCQEMDMQEKLLTWQRVHDATLAALRLYDNSLLEQRRETLAYVSDN